MLSETQTLRDEQMSSKRCEEIRAIKELQSGSLALVGSQLLDLKSNMI
jgi:hypothetical protein